MVMDWIAWHDCDSFVLFLMCWVFFLLGLKMRFKKFCFKKQVWIKDLKGKIAKQAVNQSNTITCLSCVCDKNVLIDGLLQS